MQTKTAKRYATALHAAASARGLAAETGGQLEELAALWHNHQDLRRVMLNPRIQKHHKVGILRALTEKMALALPLANALYLLLDKGRLDILPTLFREYLFLEDAAAGRTRARCYVAHTLSEQQLESLRQELRRISGAKELLLTLEIEPSLLAGFTANIEGKIIDGSLKGGLQRLKARLAR